MGNVEGSQGGAPQQQYPDSESRISDAVYSFSIEETDVELKEMMSRDEKSGLSFGDASGSLINDVDHAVGEVSSLSSSSDGQVGFVLDGAKEDKNVSQKRLSSGTTGSSSFNSSRGSGSNSSPRTIRVTPRASSSFDERFKYKISIYSKVSGCRMTNLRDYTIVKQVRVVILQYIAHGNPHEVLGVKFAYEKMKNGGLQIITDDKRLSDALGGLSCFAAIPCKMTFPNSPRVVGFVKELPVDMEPAELKREIRKILPEVYSVRYITERPAGRSRPSQRPCAFISFNLRYLPGSIRVYGKDYEVQVPNPMQCTRCCRYGHQGKQCRAELRCPTCACPHSKQQCLSTKLRCVNCKGSHASTSHECLIWQQGKLMNELRYRGGMTAEEAIDVATEGKIQHKKHAFIAPDEYFDNLESFYLGSGDGSSDDAEILNSTMNQNTTPPDLEEVPDSPRKSFHPNYVATQIFLDLMTDLYLKLANPHKNYNSCMLMPGFEDDSMIEKLNNCSHKRASHIAEQFKSCVLKTLMDKDNEDFVVSSV